MSRHTAHPWIIALAFYNSDTLRRSWSASPDDDDTAPWLIDWIAVSVLTAVLVSSMDAALIERKLSYFTGGFLSEDHVTHRSQAAGFLAASLLADVAVASVVVAFVLWLCGRARIVRRYAVPVAFVAAIVPPIITNFVTYQLMQYLGDAFDFALMFDLSGRSLSEVLAVSSAHLLGFAIVAAVLVAATIAGISVLRRRGRSLRSRVERVSLRRAMAPALSLLVAALIGTTVARLGSVVVDTGIKWKPSGRLLGDVVQAVSDVDRDGAGLFSRPGDPALFDASVRPYATEVPGNGIDEDGVGGDLPMGPAYGEPRIRSAPWRTKPDIVIFFLESIRGDVIGQAFGGAPVTPTLNALAAQGVSARAYSHNGFTIQSRQHLFTGSVANVRGKQTLLDDFRNQGYQTAYFSAQDESFGGGEYSIGFERVDVAYDARQDVDRRFSTFATPGSLAVPYQVVVERVSTFLRERSRDKPLLLVVNFQDTHFPYYHRGIKALISDEVLGQFDIAPGRAAALRAMYLNTTRNVDEAVSQVLGTVRQSVTKSPGVVVLSDHGESLYDEGFLGHGYALNEAQTRIPLIITGLPVVLAEPVAQADIRDALVAALEAPEGSHPPEVTQDALRGVFQYLGSINRPAQVALTRLRRQIIHDFRTGRVQINHSEWRRPESLTGVESQEWLELVHRWERMVIARRTAETR